MICVGKEGSVTILVIVKNFYQNENLNQCSLENIIQFIIGDTCFILSFSLYKQILSALSVYLSTLPLRVSVVVPVPVPVWTSRSKGSDNPTVSGSSVVSLCPSSVGVLCVCLRRRCTLCVPFSLVLGGDIEFLVCTCRVIVVKTLVHTVGMGRLQIVPPGSERLRLGDCVSGRGCESVSDVSFARVFSEGGLEETTHCSQTPNSPVPRKTPLLPHSSRGRDGTHVTVTLPLRVPVRL